MGHGDVFEAQTDGAEEDRAGGVGGGAGGADEAGQIARIAEACQPWSRVASFISPAAPGVVAAWSQ